MMILSAILGVLQALEISWKGYLSIFVVILAVMFVVWILNKVFRK